MYLSMAMGCVVFYHAFSNEFDTFIFCMLLYTHLYCTWYIYIYLYMIYWHVILVYRLPYASVFQWPAKACVIDNVIAKQQPKLQLGWSLVASYVAGIPTRCEPANNWGSWSLAPMLATRVLLQNLWLLKVKGRYKRYRAMDTVVGTEIRNMIHVCEHMCIYLFTYMDN